MTDSLALLCRPCFLSSPYNTSKSLQLKISTGTGDFCSCGDSEIWGSSWPSSSSSACAHHHSTHPLGNDDDNNDRIDVDSEPDRELDSLQDMVATLLDYVLTTLGATSSEPQLPTNATAISSLARIQPSDLHPTETTALRQEQMMFKAGKSHGGGGAPKYAVVLWNDEKHTREDVAVQLGDAVGWDEHKGFECAERIHKEGRETILVSTDLDVLLHVAHTLAQVDLGVTFRPAKDVFHEVVSSHIVSFLLDVAGLEGTKWRRAMWNELRVSVRHVPQLGGPGGFGLGKATRFERLLLDHTKWWKRPRAEWGQLMGRMGISSNEVRLEMGQSFSFAFPSQAFERFDLTDMPELGCLGGSSRVAVDALSVAHQLLPVHRSRVGHVHARTHVETVSDPFHRGRHRHDSVAPLDLPARPPIVLHQPVLAQTHPPSSVGARPSGRARLGSVQDEEGVALVFAPQGTPGRSWRSELDRLYPSDDRGDPPPARHLYRDEPYQAGSREPRRVRVGSVDQGLSSFGRPWTGCATLEFELRRRDGQGPLFRDCVHGEGHLQDDDARRTGTRFDKVCAAQVAPGPLWPSARSVRRARRRGTERVHEFSSSDALAPRWLSQAGRQDGRDESGGSEGRRDCHAGGCVGLERGGA